MGQHEEGAMIIHRYEPYDEQQASTPQSFVARPVKKAVFTHSSYSVFLGNYRFASYFVEEMGWGTMLPMTVTLA